MGNPKATCTIPATHLLFPEFHCTSLSQIKVFDGWSRDDMCAIEAYFISQLLSLPLSGLIYFIWILCLCERRKEGKLVPHSLYWHLNFPTTATYKQNIMCNKMWNNFSIFILNISKQKWENRCKRNISSITLGTSIFVVPTATNVSTQDSFANNHVSMASVSSPA